MSTDHKKAAHNSANDHKDPKENRDDKCIAHDRGRDTYLSLVV